MWKNPGSVDGRQEEQKYQNPVSLESKTLL